MRKLLLTLLSLALTSSVYGRDGDSKHYCGGSGPTQVTFDNRVVTITTDATPNTEGAWSEVENAVTSRVDLIDISLHMPGPGSATANFLCDVGIGAALSESEVISNIGSSSSSGATDSTPIVARMESVPVVIPSGSRIAVRCQSETASGVVRISITGRKMRRATTSNPVTMGAVTAASTGTNVDPGASADTKGSYVELEDSTTQIIRQLWVHISGWTDENRVVASQYTDIATGPATETVLIADLRTTNGGGNDQLTPQYFGPFAVNIAPGTRLTARAESSTNTDGDRDTDVILYGSSEPMGAPCF